MIAIRDDYRTRFVVQIRRVRVVLIARRQWLYLVEDQGTVRSGHIRTDQKGLLGGGGRSDRTALRDKLVAVHRLGIAEKWRGTC